MTSKEALERLYDRANHDEYIQRKNTEQSLAFLKDNALFKELIKQDLERKEQLEQRFDDMYISLNKVINANTNVIKELTEENEKLKKALDILKKYYKIIVTDVDFPIYETPQYTLGIRFHSWNEKPEGLFTYITKEHFELLKGVLENESNVRY